MNEDISGNAFVLQGYDSLTETVCVEWRVRIVDLDRLRSILAPGSPDDPDLTGTYTHLSHDDIRRIGQLCLPPFLPHPVFTGISRPHFAFDAIPYLVHTNFELPLMLEGRKPLAVFGNEYPSTWFDEFLAPFEPFVLSGQIVREIIDIPIPGFVNAHPNLVGVRHVIFALPGEQWRIGAYVEGILGQTQNWNDDLERLQGRLLGYEDWQNDWWIEHRNRLRGVGDMEATKAATTGHKT